MALWTGLGQAATVTQLVGADIGGLISMIMQAALTARQNRSECEQLARRVFMIAELLPQLQLQDPEAVRPLAGLGDTLGDAHELVVSCQGRSVAYQLVMSGRQADRFREVQSKIDSYLILFPIVSYIGITRRLDRIYNILIPDDATNGEPSPLFQSTLVQSEQVVQEVLPHGTEGFELLEIVAASNNFDLGTKIGEGGSAMVYKGRLQDGRKVVIKRGKYQNDWVDEEFRTEIAILSRPHHKHIIHLVGWYMHGYAAPEHVMEGHPSPASDVYSFGMVMLEMLTGMQPHLTTFDEEPPMTLASFGLPAIEAGNLRKVLDRRPALEVRHFKALELVASMAMRCLRLSSRDRTPISVVVANLEMALELICSVPDSVSQNKFKRFFFPKNTKSIQD